MAIGHCKDVENGETVNGLEDLEKPFIQPGKIVSYEDDDESGSIWMVLLSTFVAVCGSFEFGSCVSILTSLILQIIPVNYQSQQLPETV